jgi:hypothetical protein
VQFVLTKKGLYVYTTGVAVMETVQIKF